MAKSKQRLAFSYEANGVRHSIIVVEAKFGWIVTFIENGNETRKLTGVMGSLMTVMANAMSGQI